MKFDSVESMDEKMMEATFGIVVVATWKESTSVVERLGNCLLRVGARYLLPEELHDILR